MNYLRVKNWEQFQHYTDRNPPWIKLHRSLLDDYEFSRLQDASKAQLILIWLFASQNGGRIPEDASFLQLKLGLKKPPDLEFLVNQGFLIVEQDASTTLAQGKQDDSLRALAREEKRREEKISTDRFEEFWKAYPRKVKKPRAQRSWKALHLANGDFEKVMAGLEDAKRSEKWGRDDGRYIPHPATWLNDREWEDEIASAVMENDSTCCAEVDGHRCGKPGIFGHGKKWYCREHEA